MTVTVLGVLRTGSGRRTLREADRSRRSAPTRPAVAPDRHRPCSSGADRTPADPCDGSARLSRSVVGCGTHPKQLQIDQFSYFASGCGQTEQTVHGALGSSSDRFLGHSRTLATARSQGCSQSRSRRLDPRVRLTRGAKHRDIVARGSPLPEYGLPEGAEKGPHADRRLTSTRSASAMKPLLHNLTYTTGSIAIGTSLNRPVLLARSVATMLPRLGSIRGDSRGREGTTARLERDDRQRVIARSPLPSGT